MVFFPWLFPGEVEVVEDLLVYLAVVLAFYCVGKVVFESLVACKHIANARIFFLDDFIESFRTKLEYILSVL